MTALYSRLCIAKFKPNIQRQTEHCIKNRKIITNGEQESKSVFPGFQKPVRVRCLKKCSADQNHHPS